MATQRIKQQTWSIWSWPYGYLVVCLNRQQGQFFVAPKSWNNRFFCDPAAQGASVPWRLRPRRSSLWWPRSRVFSATPGGSNVEIVWWRPPMTCSRFGIRTVKLWWNLVKIYQKFSCDLENFFTQQPNETVLWTIPILTRIRWISRDISWLIHYTLPFHWQKTSGFPCLSLWLLQVIGAGALHAMSQAPHALQRRRTWRPHAP